MTTMYRIPWKNAEAVAAKNAYLQQCAADGVEPTALGLGKVMLAKYPELRRKVKKVTKYHDDESIAKSMVSSTNSNRKRISEEIERYEMALTRIEEIIADPVKFNANDAYCAQLAAQHVKISEKRIPGFRAELLLWPELEAPASVKSSDTTDDLVSFFADETLAENERFAALDTTDEISENLQGHLARIREKLQSQNETGDDE